MQREGNGKIAIPALIVAALLVSALVALLPGCVQLDNSRTAGLRDLREKKGLNLLSIPIPIESYVQAQVSSLPKSIIEDHCSPEFIVKDEGDEVLYNPARLIHFEGDGFLEYKIANPLPEDAQAKTLRLFFEACAEAPSHDPGRVTDLNVYINGERIGTHTIKGDLGGKRGKYPLPSWWPVSNTQYGRPVFIEVRSDGTYITEEYSDDLMKDKKPNFNFQKVSDIGINDLGLSRPYFTLRLSVDKEAEHKGGLNLFGEKSGNYPETLTVGLEYAGEKIYQPKIAEIIDNPAKFENKTVLLAGYWGKRGHPAHFSEKTTPVPAAESFTRLSPAIYDDTGRLYCRGETWITQSITDTDPVMSQQLSPAAGEACVIKGRIKLDKRKVPYLSGCDEKASKDKQSGYCLRVHKVYCYGKRSEDFGIIYGVPPLSCGGFSVGGTEENLYVLDLIHRNIKVLRGTDGSLWKIIKTDSVLPDTGFPWGVDIAVDSSGIVHLLLAESGHTRVVTLDDTGRVLTEYPVQEMIAKKIDGEQPLMRTGKGEVVLNVGAPWVEHRWYSFKERKFFGSRFRVTINDEHDLIEIARNENGGTATVGSYQEKYIVTAEIFGEDKYGNLYVWTQVDEMPPDVTTGRSTKLRVLRFSKEGKLLDSLLIPHDDYFAMDHLKLFTVDKEGNIYQVLSAEDRLEVNIWSLRSGGEKQTWGPSCGARLGSGGS